MYRDVRRWINDQNAGLSTLLIFGISTVLELGLAVMGASISASGNTL